MADRYTITDRVDQGGMAEVFRGVAESIQGFKKSVAIKRILPNLAKNKKFVAMFLDEARVSLNLQHANIVQVFDIGRGSDESYFIVMEYVDGANLKHVIEQQRRAKKQFAVPAVLYILIEVCKGLAYAHEATDPTDMSPLGIVHRDVSPPNILMSRNGEVKLVDFGLAKATSQLETTDPGVVKGKFSYLSPEAASGKPVDGRADVFAVGIILWEMLTGKRLFYGDTDYQTVELVRQARIPSLIDLNPKVTPELEQVVLRALARDPDDRFQHAADMQEALAHVLFGGGMKVTSRDIARLVQDAASLRAKARKGKTKKQSLIDTLINDEIGRFTSIEDEDPVPAGSKSLSPEVDADRGPHSPLNPGAFVDTRSWVDDFSDEPATTMHHREDSVSAAAATPEARISASMSAPVPEHDESGEIESLQQILEPTGVHRMVRPRKRSVLVAFLISVVIASLVLGGFFLFRTQIFGDPVPAPTQPR